MTDCTGQVIKACARSEMYTAVKYYIHGMYHAYTRVSFEQEGNDCNILIDGMTLTSCQQHVFSRENISSVGRLAGKGGGGIPLSPTLDETLL